MYYNPLKKKKIDVVVSRASSYSLLASLLLSLTKKIKIMTYKEANYDCIYNHRTTKTNQKYPSVNL